MTLKEAFGTQADSHTFWTRLIAILLPSPESWAAPQFENRGSCLARLAALRALALIRRLVSLLL